MPIRPASDNRKSSHFGYIFLTQDPASTYRKSPEIKGFKFTAQCLFALLPTIGKRPIFVHFFSNKNPASSNRKKGDPELFLTNFLLKVRSKIAFSVIRPNKGG